MLIPKGKVVYENLNTSFTNLNELVSELKDQRHTGYVGINYWNYQGVFFFDGGNLINALEETDDQRIVGFEAVNHVLEKALEKDGTISVYQMPAETVTLLASAIGGEALHKELSSEFTSLPRLIEKLCAQEHTGYIEVTTNDSDGAGMIFMQSGELLISIFSLNGETSLRQGECSEIISFASNRGATFNVYHSDPGASISNSLEVMAGLELPTLLEIWGDILAITERIVQKHASSDTFTNALKDTRIQLSEKYPYLDPFAAEFEYESGKLSLRAASVRQVNQALGECLLETIASIDDSLTRVELQSEVRDALAFLEENRAEEFVKFDLAKALPGLLK